MKKLLTLLLVIISLQAQGQNGQPPFEYHSSDDEFPNGGLRVSVVRAFSDKRPEVVFPFGSDSNTQSREHDIEPSWRVGIETYYARTPKKIWYYAFETHIDDSWLRIETDSIGNEIGIEITGDTLAIIRQMVVYLKEQAKELESIRYPQIKRSADFPTYKPKK